MQNSFTFNGFNSIDLFEQTEPFDQSRNPRRNSLGNIDSLNQSNINTATPQLNSAMLNNEYSFQLNNSFLDTSNTSSGSMEQVFNNNSLILQYMRNQQQERSSPFCNSNLNSDFNRFNTDSSNFQQFSPQMLIPPHRPQVKSLKPELRRNSFCASTLRPVHESRPSSPVLFSRELKHHKNQQIQQKIESNFNKDAMVSSSNYNRKTSLDSSNILFKTKFRRTSIGSNSSFGSTNSVNRLEINDEKLAKSGNIFERREDWSIISKLPVNKQNTIHIRLDDEGPYGNDETRCFVLSHFSSLCIRELACVFCGCELVIYDRFPLIDGTLFVSPLQYNQKRSVPASISKKEQFIYAMCLKCLNGEGADHEIKCKFCQKSWSNGNSLQIGTLYKFDIFAAWPCCQKRVSCKVCQKPLVDIESGGLPYFSMYSEEVECNSCKVKSYHFIKPLDEIFEKSKCELKRDEAMSATGKIDDDSMTS